MKNRILVMFFTLLLVSSLVLAVSFSYHDMDLRHALYDVSKSFNIPVILSDDVGGWIDISFEADNIEDALKTVLLSTNYTFARWNDVYLIGSANSPDTNRVILFKSKVVLLKDTYPKTVYDLLGSLSKYVVYSPDSMFIVIDANDQIRQKIMNMISKIDVPNSNRFFSYEIHEVTEDEYQRFRRFEQYNKSGILTLSNVSFDIFKEIIKINGESDTFGTVALPTIGEMEISTTDPILTINLKSLKNTVNISVRTAGNAIASVMSPEKNHAVISLKEGNKRFLVLTSFADTPKESEIFPSNEENPVTRLIIVGRSNPIAGQHSGTITYGSTDLSVIAEVSFGADATPAIALGLKANLIDNMYGTVELKLENGQPLVYAKIIDTTSVEFFKLRASVSEEIGFEKFKPLQMSLGIGLKLWNIDMFGGLVGEWNALQPYIEASLSYEWLYGLLLWKQTSGYTFGFGIITIW